MLCFIFPDIFNPLLGTLLFLLFMQNPMKSDEFFTHFHQLSTHIISFVTNNIVLNAFYITLILTHSLIFSTFNTSLPMLAATAMSKALLKSQSKFFFSETAKRKVVLFPGNGIGPEISHSVIEIFKAANVPIEWEHHQIHTKGQTADGDLISQQSMDAVRNYRYGLKGPFETPIGKGFRSLNVTLRKKLQLYANVRPCRSIEGVNTPYKNVDLITIRQNTEGEYSGLEHEVVPGVVENLKIISRTACENIANYAFEYAKNNGRNDVIACHKAGIMKMGDGLFIKVASEVAKKYPTINYREQQIDTVCMNLANDPTKFQVMVMPNLYGDIVSDLCAGLIGGLGLTASGNIGKDCEVYEAVHGTAPDIAGKNLANPTALLLSSTMMLKAMGLRDYGNAIETSIFKVMKEGKYLTGDLGGKAKTTEFTKAIIENLRF